MDKTEQHILWLVEFLSTTKCHSTSFLHISSLLITSRRCVIHRIIISAIYTLYCFHIITSPAVSPVRVINSMILVCVKLDSDWQIYQLLTWFTSSPPISTPQTHQSTTKHQTTESFVVVPPPIRPHLFLLCESLNDNKKRYSHHPRNWIYVISNNAPWIHL